MALGKREAKQTGMWVAATELPRSPGHGFYEKLNRLLDEADFDRQVEARRCTHFAYVERSFAHVCETGGARRTWVHGLTNVAKRYWLQAAAHNLGALMRALHGVGTPRSLQGSLAALWVLLYSLWTRLVRMQMQTDRSRSTPAPTESLATCTAAERHDASMARFFNGLIADWVPVHAALHVDEVAADFD